MTESTDNPKHRPPGPELTHVDAGGAARMVDVSAKPVTHRRALARGAVHLKPETLALALSGNAPKGGVFETARIAGIQAAKKTSELIPLCHPIPLASIRIDFEPVGERQILVTAEAVAADRTGVEMEALVAVTAAALTIYDMLKGVERGISISDIWLEEKQGGRSGHYIRGAGLRPDGD
ncbi:MAG: cyclic pyranopterin monophosphate synthase MoaC [Planctomycetota bacterium]